MSQGLDSTYVVSLLPSRFPNRPESLGGPLVFQENRQLAGVVMLGAFRCIMHGSFNVAGGCVVNGSASAEGASAAAPDANRPLLSGGAVLGGRALSPSSASELLLQQTYSPAVGQLYKSLRPGATPQFAMAYDFPLFQWEAVPAAEYETMQVSASTDVVSADTASAQSTAITLASTPTTLEFTTLPAAEVLIGQPFLVRGVVRVSSGAPFEGATVTLRVSPASGASTSPLGFLTTIYGAQAVEEDNDPPSLNQSTAVAISDEAGLVRFVARFVAGPPNASCTLTIATGSVESRRSSAVAVYNRVQETNSSNVTYVRVGSDGIGNPNTYEVRVLRQPAQKFPVKITLPETVYLTLTMVADEDSELSHIAWLRERIRFRVFSQEDLDQIAEQRRKQAKAEADLAAQQANATNSLTVDATASTQAAGASALDAASTGNATAVRASIASSGWLEMRTKAMASVR